MADRENQLLRLALCGGLLAATVGCQPSSSLAAPERELDMSASAQCADAAQAVPLALHTPADGESQSVDELRGACQSGHRDQCVELGARLGTEYNVVKDVDCSLAMLSDACDQVHPTACVQLAELAQRHEPAASFAIEMNDRLCRLLDGPSCTALGRLHFAGVVEEKRDLIQVVKLATEPCESGYAPACTLLGDVYLEIPIEPQVEKGVRYHEQACTLGDAAACAHLARHIERGRVSGKGLEEAFSLARSSCQQRSGLGCAVLGTFYERGITVPADAKSAVSLFEKSCALMVGEGCFRQGRMLAHDPDLAREWLRTSELWKVGCARQGADACLMESVELFASGATLEAQEKLKKSCRLGSSLGCVEWGRRLVDGEGFAQNAELGIILIKSQCSEEIPAACMELAARESVLGHSKSSPPPTELEERLKHNRAAIDDRSVGWQELCRGGDVSGCSLLSFAGMMLVEDRFVTRDVSEAVRMLDLACGWESSSACQSLLLVGQADMTDLERETFGAELVRAEERFESLCHSEEPKDDCVDMGGWSKGQMRRSCVRGEREDCQRLELLDDIDATELDGLGEPKR